MNQIEKAAMELQAGNAKEENFAILFRHFYPRLVKLFPRYGFSADASRDLSQDVLLRAVHGIKHYRFEASFERWIYTIAANTARNALRASAALAGRAQEVPLHSFSEENQSIDELYTSSIDSLVVDDTLSSLLSEERVSSLRESIVQLPGKLRRCVELRYGRELGIGEIARILEISESTVKVNLSEARLKLSELAHNWTSDVGDLDWRGSFGDLDDPEELEINPVVSNLVQICDSELLAWLARHPEDLETVHPGTFERIVAEIFDSEGFEVKTVSSWNQADGGVDLFAVKKIARDMDIRLAIQCKRFNRERRVSAEPIRSLVGVLDRFRVHAGVIASTSFFTDEANQEARQHFWRISLRDFHSIVRSLQSSSGFHLQTNGLWVPSGEVQ